ncbi:FMN-dependent NADH-azoreductase [Conexibacter sp. CPCC 206217]|uniref:FMN-dependent NADH-azoreductase n=1 Tax=Conexibacter sp. CPCC 206217 TaxID=3064574 RepID=UPI00271EC1F4|nr:NAD(P)H-dependent oxidoreductase [Conexibacter sp. CPCC 206217]MDO8211254.1 NAD(P)H-dependent oxidoreductase [Conexibacter sp. CPCC 206217]
MPAPQLLQIDSSIQGDRSISRSLTARAAERWKAAHPGGEVVYRDLAANPLPHLDPDAGLARFVPADQHNAGQAAAFALSKELIDEVKTADTVLLGLPIYNFGAPSTVKAWVDHLVFPGLSTDATGSEGLLGDTEVIVLIARGGGYAPGTPREGWDHGSAWLPHGVALTGLEPRFITAELTLADVNPAMEHLRELAAESLRDAQREVDALWEPAVV